MDKNTHINNNNHRTNLSKFNHGYNINLQKESILSKIIYNHKNTPPI